MYDPFRRGRENNQIFTTFFQTKSLLDMDLIFERDPKELHPFDFDTYFASDMTCEIVVTNCESGQAEYYSEKEDGDRLMQLCRASSSMPLVTPMVEIDGVPYLDGGIADSIPLIHSMRSGYRKNRSDPDQKQRIPQDHIQTGYSDVSDGF